MPNNPLSAFRSSTESSTYQSRLGEVASTSSTSLAVSPSSTFSRFQAATQPWRQPTSSLLPSQRFSRSQGLNPPRTCRPYFMPVPSLRFYPSRFSHPRSRTSSRTPLPSCGYPDLWLPHHPFALPGYPGGIPSKHRHIVDAAPWKPDPTSRPCSPRASVLMVGGLDRSMSRNPLGLFPP